MTTSQPAPQRRFSRYPLDVPARLIMARGNHTRIVHGRGRQINEGGMGVYAGVELRVGDRVEVEFSPPDSSLPIRVGAVVRNRDEYYYGMEFLSASQAEQALVGSVVRELAAKARC